MARKMKTMDGNHAAYRGYLERYSEPDLPDIDYDVFRQQCAEYSAGHVSDLLDHDSQNGKRTDFHTERAGLRSGCQGVRPDQMADSDPSSDSEQHGKYHCNDDVPDSFRYF